MIIQKKINHKKFVFYTILFFCFFTVLFWLSLPEILGLFIFECLLILSLFGLYKMIYLLFDIPDVRIYRPSRPLPRRIGRRDLRIEKNKWIRRERAKRDRVMRHNNSQPIQKWWILLLAVGKFVLLVLGVRIGVHFMGDKIIVAVVIYFATVINFVLCIR